MGMVSRWECLVHLEEKVRQIPETPPRQQEGKSINIMNTETEDDKPEPKETLTGDSDKEESSETESSE